MAESLPEVRGPSTAKGYRVEALVYLGVALFFALVCAVYWFTSYEHAGSVMLILTAFLGFLPGAYLYWWGRHMKPRPEDVPEADLEDGAGAVGAFPTSSIWPFVMGVGLAFVALGFVFGIWWGMLGMGVVVSALIGYTMETRRGGYI
ncbi:MAG TPA: cytochrome c oxidase subunit 4 [Acidimicrobiales bacterium]|nr:cytochrome c oxidase subunit 4 [Acidimicrobiales bacterium]